MKKIFFLFLIISLITITSFVKFSTRSLESEIFNIQEELRILTDKKQTILLERAYLSSPDRLFRLKNQYFDNEFFTININKIKRFKITGE